MIPVTVVAKNEERAIRACLEALLASSAAIDLLVVLDDCTDSTESICASLGVRTIRSSGGKVEGQRRGLRSRNLQIFCDADVLVDRDTIAALRDALQSDPAALVAAPPLEPLPPQRRTPLAWALHLYNLRRGFSSKQAWFSGRCFAMRGLELPSRESLRERARGLHPSRFYDWEGDLRADDVWLSRLAAGRIARTASGAVRFRAPETLRGMYRYYRRLRRELERTDALFPESRPAFREADLVRRAPPKEKLAYAIFNCALAACNAAYLAERWLVEIGLTRLEIWPAVEETKAL